MDIGSLRHRITIESPVSAPDGEGGYTETWSTFANRIPASVLPATTASLERLMAGAVQTTATDIVRIRYLSGISTAMRVRFESRVLGITGVSNPDGRRIEHVLLCTESGL